MIMQSSGGGHTPAGDRQPGDSDSYFFNPSPQTSVGIEVELPILDRETGELSPGALRLLRACEEEAIPGVTAELMQSMIEVKTDIAQSVTHARDTLMRRLHRVRNLAKTLGYDLALLATHPSAKATEHALFPDERYTRGEKRLAWMIYHRVTFGLHVHIGVRSGNEAINLINILIQYLPHMLALSANSPFWQGIDTGLASSRIALYGLVPHAGVPRTFENWKDFRHYCQTLRQCKVMGSHKDVKWDIRPRPDYGTIEFRVCDMPSTMTQVFGIAALLRCLVVFARQLLESRPQLRAHDVRRQWIAVENKWLATRFGMDAIYICAPTGKRRPLRHEVAALIEKMIPIARQLGDEAILRSLGPLDKYKVGSDHQRQIYREEGSWHAITQLSSAQLADELAAYARHTKARGVA